MAASQRVTHPVDGDEDIAGAVERFKELRAWKAGCEAEMNELKEKLGVRCAEHGAGALTVDDVQVVRYSELSRTTVDGKALQAAHPRIFNQFKKISEYTRVDVP